MAENELIQRESGTHYNILLKIEGHDLRIMVNKLDFSIYIPSFEYMEVASIVKILVGQYKEKPDDPLIRNFLKYLQQPENKDELNNFMRVYRDFD